MQKFFVLFFLLIAVAGYAQDDDILSDNPGYFESPAFLAIGGSMLYGNSDTHRDQDLRPFLMGMWNVVQSEYGNLGLSLGFMPITPYREHNIRDLGFKLSTQQYSGELGVNYVTGSKWINLFLGAGYNMSYVNTEMRNLRNTATGVGSNYTKNYSQFVYGWHYYLGLEYVLTKDGSWGLFFLFRGQETARPKYTLDKTVNFKDGSSITYNDDFDMDLNNKSYTLGVIYHF
ncbi:MAG: hypothetical protein LBV09_05085 [Deferribacteraceae bacterium]|jgi:hypothetical protein|nr:hypothetical protein [Deferribacteraceae bacterium]